MLSTWPLVHYLVSSDVGSLVNADHVIASFIHQILQLPGQLVADFPTTGVTTHVSANEEANALEVAPTALQMLALASFKLLANSHQFHFLDLHTEVLLSKWCMLGTSSSHCPMHVLIA